MADNIEIIAEPNLYQVNITTGVNLDDVVTSVNGSKGDVIVSKSTLGIPNVDNTSDVNKPISSATQTALNAKADTSYVNTQLSGKQNVLGFTPYNATNPSGYISAITQAMINEALGYTPYSASNPSNYISSITNSMVINALGFTPYDALNPNGYTNNIGTVTSVNPILLSDIGTDITTSITNSTSSPQISLNVPTASATNRGLLSPSDWNTFNSKQAQLSGSTNYLARWSSGSNIGISIIYDNGTNIGINRTNPTSTLDINGTLNVEGTSILRALAGTGQRLMYVDSTGQVTPAIIGSGLSMVSGTLSATGTASGSIGGSGTIGYVPKFSGTAAITNSNIQDSGSLITLGSNSYINGSLGIGTVQPVTTNIYIRRNLTGATSMYSLLNESVVQSDVTSSVSGYFNQVNTQAAAFTLSNYYNFHAAQGTIGAGSIITSQYGFYVNATLIGATNNYGFYGNIPSGTNRWNLYMNGTANNYLAGGLGIGTTSLGGVSLNVSKSITGATTSYGIIQNGTVQSDATSTVFGNFNQLNTQATTFTLGGYNHYTAAQGTIGSGSVVTEQNGFYVASTLTGATFNYGFRGLINAAGGRYNLFLDGTAVNYMNGGLGIGTTSIGNFNGNLAIASNITGNVNSRGIHQFGTTQSDVTTSASGYMNTLNTQAATFTLGEYRHYFATQGTIGSGSTITTQYGFFASGTLTGATNNYGFYSNIASGTGRYNIYMNGTADNYLAGSLGIGSTSSLNTYSFSIGKTITGGGFSGAIINQGTIQSDVTTAAFYNVTIASTQATTFTLPSLSHYDAQQGTFGAGSTVSSQYGFRAHSTLIGGTYNFGFRGDIAAGTGRWNLYMNGTAQNYMAGALGIGIAGALSSNNASALLQVDSTTQGVLFPRMTTTQKNAISSPATGLVVFDTTLGKLCVFSTTWQTITSS